MFVMLVVAAHPARDQPLGLGVDFAIIVAQSDLLDFPAKATAL